MTPSDPTGEEDLASVLAACDEAMAEGTLPSISSSEKLSPEQSRLLKGLDCVRLLREVWPRQETTLPPGQTSIADVPPCPTHLGRFRIAKELGRGGFGVVYLAFDPRLGRPIALKVPRPDVLPTTQLRERFRQEARAAAALDHPNIVAVHETGEIDGVTYIAAAYCPGDTLATWLEGRPEGVPFRLAATVLIQLADAVEHAHRRDILHRDLKPANVMLAVTSGDDGPVPVAKITDFGLARTLGPAASPGLTASGAILGTPNYLAPEQAREARGKDTPIGPPVDVYGLGAILYEVLTQRPPFVSDSALETLRQVRMDDPVPPRSLRAQIPRDLETICLKCLEKDPAHRYRSAGEIAAELRRFVAGEPIMARPPGWAGRAAKWARRKPALAALLTGIVAVTLLGSAGAYWFEHDRQVRRTGTERDVNAVVEETIALYGRAQGAETNLSLWADALASAKRADTLAAAGDAPPELRTRVKALLSEIERHEKNQRLIASLEDIQASMGDDLLPNGDQDFPRANDRYLAALNAYGLNLDKLSPEQGAEALRALGSGVRIGVAEAVDNWAYVRMLMGRPNPNHLLNVSRLLDPDPVRNRLRTAIIDRDRSMLQRLLKEIDPATQTVQTVNLVAVTVSLLAHSRNYADEINFLLAAQSHHAGDFQITHNLAYALNRASRGAEAVPYATAAIALRPKSAAGWQDLAHALRQTDRVADALAAHRRAAALAPRAVWHLTWIGDLLEKLDRTDEAVAHYREAIPLVCKHSPRYGGLIRSWQKFGMLDDAVAEYGKQITATPNDADLRLGLAALLYDQKNWNAVIAECDHVLGLEPKNVAAFVRRGNVRASLAASSHGRWNDAAADIAQAIELGIDDAAIWYQHALLAAARGDRDRYRATCATMLARFGATENTRVANWLAWACVILPEATDDPSRLPELLAASLRTAPDANFLNTWGAAHYRAGQFEDARQRIAEAMKARHPREDASDMLFLAMIHQRLGQTETARHWFDKVEKWFADTSHDPAIPNGAAALGWDVQLELQLFRAEATALLKLPN